jgi:hypothetical protein
MLIVGIVAGMGVVLWARELMRTSTVAIWCGFGLMLGISSGSELFASNPWKFGISTAVTVLALAIAQRLGSRWLELGALGALGVASAVSDARSSFAIILLTIALTGWQLGRRNPTRRASVLRLVVSLAVIGFVVYTVGQTLLLDGYLGDAAQERSEAQIDSSGSLILGGRPELAATAALMVARPWGYGAGVLPSLADITVAKTGMAAIGYAPNNGYVEEYMFGNRFELHSIAGDLWAGFGIPGLLFALVVIVVVLRGLSAAIARQAASAALIYLAVRGFWNLFFGPLYGSSILLTLLLGFVIVPVVGSSSTAGELGRRVRGSWSGARRGAAGSRA